MTDDLTGCGLGKMTEWYIGTQAYYLILKGLHMSFEVLHIFLHPKILWITLGQLFSIQQPDLSLDLKS